MRIKKLALKNFGKYEEENFLLKGVNIVKGKNGAGKSTLIEAISYALTGEVRRLPKKGEDLIKMSHNGLDMSVAINSDTLDIERVLTKGKKISETLLIDGMNEETNTEKQVYLNSELNLNSSLLNPINFIGLSSIDKSKFLLDFITNEVVTKEMLFNNLEKRVPKNILTELEFDDKVSLLDNIDIFIKTSKSYKRELTKTLNSSVDSRSKLFSLEEQIASKNIDTTKIKKIEEEIISLKSQIRNSENIKLRKQDLLKRQIELKKYLEENSQKQLNLEINQLTKRLESLNIDDNFNDLNEKLSIEVEKLEKIANIGTNLKNLTKNLCSEYSALEELENKIKNISSCKKCAIDSTIICMNDNGFNNALLEFEKKKEALKLSNRECKQGIQAKINEYKIQNAKVTELRNKISESQKNLSNRLKETTEINKKIQTLTNRKTELSKYAGTLSEIEHSLTTLNDATDISMLRKLLSAKENELNVLKSDEIELVKLNENKKLVLIEESKQEDLTLRIEQLTMLEKALKIEKLSLIEEGVKPLLANINELLTEIEFPYSAFIKNDGKKATLGLINNKKELDISTLSTGETMMLVVGLLNAIYIHNKAQFRPLFIDDIDNLDYNNLKALISHSDVLKRHFDTTILMGVLESLDTTILDDVNIINLN